jgi:hypothetical protein
VAPAYRQTFRRDCSDKARISRGRYWPRSEWRGQVGDGSIIETKAATLLEFLHGLRGELHVTLEEGTWAPWLYDVLRPHVEEIVLRELAHSYLTISKDQGRVMSRLKALYRSWGIRCSGTQAMSHAIGTDAE